MNSKGVVTDVDNIKKVAKVTFKDLNNTTTPFIPYAKHVNSLAIDDIVAVAFFSDGLIDGLIIGSF